jgi:predicted GH43/DUF377 family glycosyl hydrolase
LAGESAYFPFTPGGREAAELRKFEARDRAKRLGVISPERLFINGFPVSRPIAAFNASFILQGSTIMLYPRIIIGYYKYVSAIVEAFVPLEDVLSGQVNLDYYSSGLAIIPSNPYDLWGAEDRRAYIFRGIPTITYTGRTISYLEKGGTDKTLPITAVRVDDSWTKWILHRPSESLQGYIVNDKNAFLLEDSGRVFLFHRPQTKDGEFHLTISLLGNLHPLNEGLREVEIKETWLAMPHATFEEKVGWGAPPIEVSPHLYLLLMHGVERHMQVYRVFASLVDFSGKKPVIVSVTPYYVMEPRESYEVYGDRPYIVFPCGSAKIDDEVLVSYGAGDYMVGFALINYSELLEVLDKNRLY